jgi:hypothetical protein
MARQSLCARGSRAESLTAWLEEGGGVWWGLTAYAHSGHIVQQPPCGRVPRHITTAHTRAQRTNAPQHTRGAGQRQQPHVRGGMPCAGAAMPRGGVGVSVVIIPPEDKVGTRATVRRWQVASDGAQTEQ